MLELNSQTILCLVSLQLTSCVMQERRLQAERTGRMIDLTKDVSPAVLAETAAKIDAEEKQRDDEEAEKRALEATKPFETRLVSTHIAEPALDAVYSHAANTAAPIDEPCRRHYPTGANILHATKHC